MTEITRADIERMIEVAENHVSNGPWYHVETPRISHSFVASHPDYPARGGRICECMEPEDAEHLANYSPDRIIPILRLALEALDAKERV